jgi:phage baseplate assembly protein W
MLEFLGFGLTRPFQRDGRSDFAAAGGERLIRSAVGQILGTIGSSDFTQGELPWRSDFGSLVHVLRHQRNDQLLQELGRIYVVEALKRWEPRIVVRDVQIGHSQRDGGNVLEVRLRYDVISTTTPGNVILSAVEHSVRVPSATV